MKSVEFQWEFRLPGDIGLVSLWVLLYCIDGGTWYTIAHKILCLSYIIHAGCICYSFITINLGWPHHSQLESCTCLSWHKSLWGLNLQNLCYQWWSMKGKQPIWTLRAQAVFTGLAVKNKKTPKLSCYLYKMSKSIWNQSATLNMEPHNNISTVIVR